MWVLFRVRISLFCFDFMRLRSRSLDIFFFDNSVDGSVDFFVLGVRYRLRRFICIIFFTFYGNSRIRFLLFVFY